MKESVKEISHVPSCVNIREVAGYKFYNCKTHSIDFYDVDEYNRHVKLTHTGKLRQHDYIKYEMKFYDSLNPAQNKDGRFSRFFK